MRIPNEAHESGPWRIGAIVPDFTLEDVWALPAEGGADRHLAEMAVYVKPRGAFGRGYMAAIKPFRLWIVYPALLRQVERTWNARNG